MTRALRLVLAGCLLVTACAGDDSEPEAGAAPTTTALATTTNEPVTTTALVTTTDEPVTTTAAATTTTTAPTPVPEPDDGYPDQPAGVPFPTAAWPTADLPAGVDRATLDAAVDVAFVAPDARARVRSIVVVQGGQVVYERYHPLDGPDTIMDSFSVAKSFTSALIGLLVADGRLVLDDPAPVSEWADPADPRHGITLRNLLQMSSGLEWDESSYGPGSDTLTMIQSPDASAFMAAKPLENPPGTVFEYSTGTTALLAGIAADDVGGCQAAIDYLNAQLLDPIGITTDQLLTDGGGCWLGGLGANMTTRDFARFGLLYLRGGTWDDGQILPGSWIDDTRQPASTNPGYGLQWWLDPDGRVFRARGLFGQQIVVVPDRDLVIAVNTTQGGDSDTLVGAVLAVFGQAVAPSPFT